MALKNCLACSKEFDNQGNSKICPDCQKIRIKVTCDNPKCGKEINLSSRASREYLSGKKKDHYFCSKKCAAGGYLYCNVCNEVTYHGGWSVCMKHDNPGSREDVKDKIKQTNLELYGCENVYSSPIIQEIIKETNNRLYGYDYPRQNQDINNKIKETNNKLYGYDSPLQSEIVKAKIKETNNKLFGCDYPIQNPDILRKNLSKGSGGIRTKLIFTNVTIITRSFWETVFALYLYYNKIIFEFEAKSFSYEYNNKVHYYIPDFYLPEFNYIVEIKGYQRNPERDLISGQSVINKGYNFEVIYNIKFFGNGVETNSNINLKILKESSKKCENIFEYKVPGIGSFYGF